ncbi:MAG: DUF222 domain-containing protein, partial [Microbacterium sp.]
MTASLLAPDTAAAVPPREVSALRDALDGLRGVGGRTSPDAYDALLVELDRGVRRLEAIKLEVVAAAEAARIADRTGLADTSSWLARRTRAAGARAAADVALATALAPVPDQPARPCADALAAGDLSPDHARVV